MVLVGDSLVDGSLPSLTGRSGRSDVLSTSEKLNDDYMIGRLNILRLSHKVVTLPLWLTM